MKPDIEKFREALRKTGGNISRVATLFQVTRSTVHNWAKTDPDFNQAVLDIRGSLVDECLVSARVLAVGIPERDEKGNMIGWRERQDGSMIRYILSTLGRKDGFSETDTTPEIVRSEKGIAIDKWIERETSD